MAGRYRLKACEMPDSAPTATELLARLTSGETSSEAVVSDLIERIAADPELRAFSVTNTGRALECARKADTARRDGKSLGPLHGLPIAVKDNIAVAGLVNTGGTPALANHIPTIDADIVTCLKRAGAIVIGKNTMHELAWGTTSINPFSGTPLNPHDRTRTSGGSSGGAGAAVAANLVPVAVGTDTGGSIRIPASLCGVWGFRPTTGKWSQHGIIPISSSRDTAGPLARSVDDLILLHEAVTGEATPRGLSPKGKRIGIPASHFWEFAQPEVSALCRAALERLAVMGVELVQVDVANIARLHNDSSFIVASYEGRIDLTKYLADFAPEITFRDVVERIASDDVRELMLPLLDSGGPPTSESYRAALAVRQQLIAAYDSLFAGNRLDAIAFPTCLMPAFPLSDTFAELPNAGRVPVFPAMIHNTGPGSNAGLPGVSLPVGTTASGLPVGLALDGPLGGDAGLLQLAQFTGIL
jgi:indoleacetamide hydrolase